MRLTDAECAEVLADLAARDWVGLTRDDVRMFDELIANARKGAQETNEHSAKGLASAGSSAAVNPRDTVGGSAEPSGRPAESDGPPCCLAERGGGLVCTLVKGHSGRHEARGLGGALFDSWSVESEKG